MNKWIITGNIGQDCKIETTQNGTAVCKFSVAVTSGYGENKKTTWANCLIFGKRAQGGITQYLMKGQQVAVSGEMTHEQWQNSQGEKASAVKVVVDSIDLIGGQQQKPQSNYQQPQQSPKPQQSAPQPANQNGGFDSFDDSIPF